MQKMSLNAPGRIQFANTNGSSSRVPLLFDHDYRHQSLGHFAMALCEGHTSLETNRLGTPPCLALSGNCSFGAQRSIAQMDYSRNHFQ